MKTKIISAFFASVASVASADVLLWHHFDERAPGETSQPNDTLVNAVSSDYGSGKPYSINESTTAGADAEFMPKYCEAAYSVLNDLIYDPLTETIHTNRSSIGFRTQGSTSALKGGMVRIEDVEALNKTEFTVECFVCTTGGVVDLIAPVVGMVPGGNFKSEVWQIGILNNGKMFMRFAAQPSGTSGSGASKVFDGAWHHVAIVCSYDSESNKSTYRMFVDYRLDFLMNYTGKYATSKKCDLYVGGYLDKGRKFNGMIDELRISGTALRPEQFLRRYSHFVDSDTVAYLPLDGKVGEIIPALYMNYAVDRTTNTVSGSYVVKGSTETNAILSADAGTYTLRADFSLPAPVTNNASVFLKTNGTINAGTGIRLSSYPYFAKSLTAELFFKTEGKIVYVGKDQSAYSQTILKFSDPSPVQLTLDQGHPGKIIVVCHNGYGKEEFVWTNYGHIGLNLHDGKWHHIAAVYDAENMSVLLYLDYVRVMTINNVRLSGANRHAFVGYGGESAISQFFHGKIDAVRLTQRVLSPEEFLNPTSFVYDGPDDVVFYAPFNDSLEAVSPPWCMIGDGVSREFDGCSGPELTGQVKYPELLLDGQGGVFSVTNTGSVRFNGSQLCFKNTKGLGTFDHTAEFYCKLTSIGNMAGLLRVNNKADVPSGAPLWALYASENNTHRLNIRCSTVTNGVASTERYLTTTVKLTDLTDGVWHHFAFTTEYDEESGRQQFAVYIDGEQEWTGSLLGCFYDMGEGFNVTMGYSINADGNIVGDFDEVKITRGVLPPSKFMCRYRRPRGTVVTVR